MRLDEGGRSVVEEPSLGVAVVVAIKVGLMTMWSASV